MKYYILISQEEEDEGPITRQVTAEQVRQWAKTHHHEDFAVIDGVVIKGFTKKLDVGRLKDE